MRKFKLVKEYPGMVGQLGRKAIEDKDFDCFKFEFTHGLIENFNLKYLSNKEFWQEVKATLFVTEEGIEVYDSETILWLINPSTFVMVDIRAKYWDKTGLVFYFKDKAESWIDLNKPIFSKQQILDALKDMPIWLEEVSFNDYLINKLGIK